MHRASRRCDGITRRGALQLGALSWLGLSAADLLRFQAASAAPATPAKACILIWLDGGPTHLETFDPKPDAPAEIRGPFGAIESRVAGIRIGEHLPRTAAVLDRVALVRSLTHELGNHDTGSHYLLTGHRPTPTLVYPSLGSLVAREAGLGRSLPAYVAIPDAVQSARSGYLPDAYSPFAVGGDPSRPDYQVRNLQPPEGIGLERVDRRKAMVRALDDLSRAVEGSERTASRDAFYEQAYRLITAPETRAAFDLSREPAAVRERYGRQRLGTGCLLARRLVENGARFVTVVDPGWDTHREIARELPDSRFPGSGKLPALDRAYSALLTDLQERGLLESTLVVLMGEFGRTPKLNSLGGRDHWPRAGSACLAGGGVRGGQAIGRTDASGEAPVERPIRPEDLAFTVLSLLGIDPRKEYPTADGRPMKLLAAGEFIREVR